MKKILIIVCLAFIFASCNKIEGPYIEKSGKKDVDVEFPKLDTAQVVHKILFEEYTGHRCTNCPAGHQEINRLLTEYGDDLVVVAIHSGYFAQPMGDIFNYDFRTTAGDKICELFTSSPQDIPNPAAMTNRNGDFVSTTANWQNNIRDANRTKYAAIQLINKFDDDDNFLTVYSKTTMLKEYSKSVKLSLLLIEDNIIKPQAFSDHTDLEYTHNHVLRAGINEAAGEIISPNGYVQKDSCYYYGYSIDFSGTDWVPENCSVIAILWDQDNYEVLQTEKLKVK